ncbi:MAG: FKBP-type peptidyl-prolyl cis-trans isomerase [Muribaculaceae bacterium]|nr:FKBP-type peptidyl-prolyl cis-trans isomerase [Muribaculaceae bacterium]
MKKFFYTAIMAIVAITMFDSCLGKTIEDEYKDWRENNDEWYQRQMSSGQYTLLKAPWDPSATTLIRWHNDTMQTKGNLKPLITSTVDVKYKLSLFDGTPVDSSYIMSEPADSIYRSMVNTNIEGWMIALTRMHVGDSCTIIVPYPQGYASRKMNDVLVPYSCLVFDMKLVDIFKYKAN